MKSFVDQLSKYASYHRDRRNIATHFIGIPMIVAAVVILLSRPALAVIGGVAVTPALIVMLVTSAYYVKLDWRFGVAMILFLLGCLRLGQWLSVETTSTWLTWGVGLFVVGWIFQFVGHFYEGKKPAFVDDIMGLIIGPIFVAAEVAFLLGLRKDVQHAVEARVGPTIIRKSIAA